MKAKIFIMLVLLFFLLSLIVFTTPVSQIDISFSRFAQSFASRPLRLFMNFVSILGNSPYVEVLILVSSSLFLLGGKKNEALAMFTFPALGAAIGSIIKNIVGRDRPGSETVNVFYSLGDMSYPSMHVLIFTIFFGFIAYYSLTSVKHPLIKILMIAFSVVFILSISFSRVYLGVHWLSDTIGGYLLGGIVLYLFIHTVRKLNSYHHAQR
ncbi:MAG: Membrane-associated phospholipid phosphatase [Candidatus Collierbacteria bacterium GW2011_GWB1_44_6]|uniref:Membrane-associated phospholipid phosphatase n=2 Tax=Candidatus Collieribacteriota TaxID=1752725 RepID=A0A0G1JQY8_9BACT|nr:MAG: Membrane-associated phospholipid phosphatase [Candidatus Collierbacteria bacterium GW2011_GWC2_43_12]KKT73850.1 MAG: Membrane-associated phospholipid phosphatase [Candidatus Collierbacteria bacterium GW2011_GWB1_44_6]KKT84138.1 MAG: phosphoesterase PA-phosphatase related protein [Microgenomates group bacterium GW2011_GWC1_44_9]